MLFLTHNLHKHQQVASFLIYFFFLWRVSFAFARNWHWKWSSVAWSERIYNVILLFIFVHPSTFLSSACFNYKFIIEEEKVGRVEQIDCRNISEVGWSKWRNWESKSGQRGMFLCSFDYGWPALYHIFTITLVGNASIKSKSRNYSFQ